MRGEHDLSNLIINGVWPHKDLAPFKFFEGVQIPFVETEGEYTVAVHTEKVGHALSTTHKYLGDKYISKVSSKYKLHGRPQIVNGVDYESTLWHNDLKEGANIAILMYFTSACNKEQGGSLSVRNKQTKELSCWLYPGKNDLIFLNHSKVWEHRVGKFKLINNERIVGCFDYNI